MERDQWRYMGNSTFLKINQVHVPLFNRRDGIHKIKKYRKDSFLKIKKKNHQITEKKLKKHASKEK